MFPVALGINHRTASVDIRERLSIRSSQMEEALQMLYRSPGIAGVVIISTCNRLEIYAATTDMDEGLNSIRRYLAELGEMDEEELTNYLYVHTLYDAVRHLYRVVVGLDSMVLGETQIIGQVSHAYETACEAGVTNKVINVLFQKALAFGKKARTESKIDQHPVSTSYTAVELAKNLFGSLQGRGILVLGAGEMSTLTARYLVDHGATTVLVTNRSHAKAVALAEEISGQAIHLEDMDQYLCDIDILISATASPRFLIYPDRMGKVMEVRKNRPLLMIDIAVPRDIHPEVGNIPGITLYDVDALKIVKDEHIAAREKAAEEIERVIDNEMADFINWHNSLFVVPTIAALQEKAQHIKDALLERSLDRLGDISPRQEKIIRSMANSIVNHLLHYPISHLKEAAITNQGHLYTEILQKLFELDIEKKDFSMGGQNENNSSGNQR